MTFDEIVDRVATRLNLTGTIALTRVGLFVNERFARLSSSVGLSNVSRTPVPLVVSTVIGTPLVTVTGLERIYSVSDPTATPPRLLSEVTNNELKLMPPGTDPPRAYAINQTGAGSVQIKLNCTPSSIYSLWVDGDADVSTLSGSMVPPFPAKYHDVLVYGAYASELEHMDKYDKAAVQEARWERMLSELRLYLASSAYLDIHQGKNSPYDRNASWVI